MEQQVSPLTTEDYQALMAMSRSDDPEVRGKAAKLSKKLTPEEQQAFFDVQTQGNASKERNRVDNSIFGLPPELAAAGVFPVGRAIAGARGIGGRLTAGAKETASQAMPAVKYEVVKTSLEAAGVPSPVATVLAIGAAGYNPRRGPAPQQPAASPAAAPIAAEKPLSPRDFTKQVTAEHRAKLATNAPAAPVETAKDIPKLSEATRLRMKLTPEEAEVYQGLWVKGMPHDKAIAAVKAMRQPAAGDVGQLTRGLPTDAEVKRRVAARNATGRWSE